MIKATLSTGGFNEESPCVYLLIFRNRDVIHVYAGKTGSSNNSGVNSPFGRLGTHLKKAGATYSVFWTAPKEIRYEWMNSAKAEFVAEFVDPEYVRAAEDWLTSTISKELLLNENIAEQTPDLPDDIVERLESLIAEI